MGIAEDAIFYIIRGISAFGALFNLTTTLVLFKSKFQHEFYDLLQCRCVCNLIVCLLTVYTTGPLQCRGCEDDFTSLAINILVIILPLRMAYIASAISGNLLILDRLANLYQWSNSVLSKLKKSESMYFGLMLDFSLILFTYLLGQSLDLLSCADYINKSRLFCFHG